MMIENFMNQKLIARMNGEKTNINFPYLYKIGAYRRFLARTYIDIDEI